MADPFDDFFDDPKDKPSPPKTNPLASSSALLPIVEVPSEVNSVATDSARSAATDKTTPRSARSLSNSNLGSASDGGENVDINASTYPPKSPKKKKRSTQRDAKHIDMTPPDKLLVKANKKAKRYTKDKKVDQAIKEYVKCTALARIVYGADHWKLAQAFVNLAEAYLDLKSYHVQAHYHSEHARVMMMNTAQFLESSKSEQEKADLLEVLLNIYYILGRSLTASKKFTEAEHILTKAENIASRRAKIDSISDDDLDEWDVKIFLAIARLSAKQQKTETAIAYFDKALEIMEDIHGKDSIELVTVYHSLGLVEQSKRGTANHEAAIEHFLQAHSITSAYYGNDSEEAADTARVLATAYSRIGEEDSDKSADGYLNEALITYQSIHGPMHEKTIDVQDEIAKAMIRQEKHTEAISLLRKSLEYKVEVFGEFSSSVSDTWQLIGNIYLATQEPEKALKALRRCCAIQTTAHGPGSKNVKETQKVIDLLLANPQIAAKQKKSKAEELKERPRFNSIVNRSSQGATKPIGY